MIDKTLKSQILTNIIRSVPTLVESEKTVKEMVTRSNPLLGMEDGAALIGEVSEIGEDAEKLYNPDIFPSVKLKAELDVAKQINRNKWLDFNDKWNDLQDTIKDIDDEFGPHVEFLLDEIKQVPGVNAEEVNKLINADVDLENLDSRTLSV